MRPSRRSLVVAAALAVSATAALASGPGPGEPPAYVRRAADVPAYPIAQGKGTAAIFYDAAHGSPDTALTVLVLQPGAAVPEHVHDASAELLYILEGAAEMTVAGDTLTVNAGDAVRIPMGTPHSARVVGDHALRAVQVYAPAGPEQRFVPKP